MTPFIFANNIKTTLASAVSSTATTITLASSTDLPSSIPTGYYLPITLNDAATGQVYEIVYATAVSGASLTVVRAQEGTSAGTWAIGDYVFCGPTAGQMTSPTAEIISVLTAAGLTPDRTNTGQLLEAIFAVPGKNIAVFTPTGATVNGSAITWSNGGNWTVPAGVSKIQAFCTGGGGGGAGATPNYGATGNYISSGCGGAGGTAIGVYSVTAGSTLAITVGGGGAGGYGSAPPTGGGGGGTSSVGTLCSAPGGGGGGWGTVQSGAGGAGGVGTGGQINLSGGYGGDGQGGTYIFASVGGASYWGGGGRAATGNAIAGQAPGSGGGGVYVSNADGGAGADGVVVIVW